MDDDVRALVATERIAEAAALASSRGDFATAADLFERACDWKRAAQEAERAHDWARALRLAVEARDDARADAVLPEVAKDAKLADRVAYHLAQRGAHAWTARIYEAIGRANDAAHAWERAGDTRRAARLYERAGDVVAAARALESQIRREPHAWPVYVALGGLLLRYGKTDAAVRALQKVPSESSERRAALTLLVDALGKLDLGEAREEAAHELTSLGGAMADDNPAPANAPVKTRLFGRYEVVREVAQSPSARVVECMDGVRGERVAVKIFAAYDARGGGRDALARFEREVKVLGSLDHPNVVPLRDYLPEGPALVLAWMTGGTLEALLAREPIAPARAVEIACAVLAALAEAHRLGVLHRDVKPANVLFDDAGVTRLGDFGVAHLGDLSATATAGVIGTLGYMSPEQREGRPATVRSDVYGVGAMLWEMLTGERPSAHEAPRARPSGAHRDLRARHDETVLAMLAADPESRPQDAYAARRALTALAWPNEVERAAPMPRKERAPSEHPAAARVSMDMHGRTIDTWLGRPIELTPLTDGSLSRASSFAKAGHPALQTVLRVDRQDAQIWLAPARGRPIGARTLTPREAALAADALAELHRAGGIHGHINADHILVDEDGAVCICFVAEATPTSTVDLDRLDLARLAGHPF